MFARNSAGDGFNVDGDITIATATGNDDVSVRRKGTGSFVVTGAIDLQA